LSGIGLDHDKVDALDLTKALRRIHKDIQTDFIYAPHFSVIFSSASTELSDRLLNALRSGNYNPSLPISLEVPKASGFTRPGSILMPADRLAYQALVDAIAPEAEKEIDRAHVFSNRLLKDDPEGFMFEAATPSYDSFREAIGKQGKRKNIGYALRADVASYFERLYLHRLVNSLYSAECDSRVVSCLEKLLIQLNQMDSHGICQGLLPSDFLGNFYLVSIDANHRIRRIPFVRYVDDIYAFFETKEQAEYHKLTLGTWLRKDGLGLNEMKTRVYAVDSLIREETEIDRMLADATEEVEEALRRGDFYQTTMSWDDESSTEETDEEEIDLEATRVLFDQDDVSEGTREKIEKFCIRAFIAAKDSKAVERVLVDFQSKPHLAQIYSRYLREFTAQDPSIMKAVERLIASGELQYEFQLMWLYAMSMSSSRLSRKAVDQALAILIDARFGECLRATAAVAAGKFGIAQQRKVLEDHYQREPSAYVRAAILYSAHHFPSAERNNFFRAWGGHSEVNSLIVRAIKAT
jgi:hypothetical protein